MIDLEDGFRICHDFHKSHSYNHTLEGVIFSLSSCTL